MASGYFHQLEKQIERQNRERKEFLTKTGKKVNVGTQLRRIELTASQRRELQAKISKR